MSKIALVNLANLQNENTAVSAINTNNATVTNAIDNTLSRNGAQPNEMEANLDMNSFQILNLPSPATMNSPARLVDVVTNPTVTVTLPITGNNTWTGTNTFNGVETFVGDAYFKSGRPWYDVRAFGCVGNGTTNDTANFQAALTAAGNAGGGIVFIPTGTYKLSGGVTVPTQVHVLGAGRDNVILTSGNADISVITTTFNATAYLEGFWVLGKGINDTGTFAATQPAILFQSSNGFVRDVRIWGGAPAINITGNDNYFLNLECGLTYGNYNVLTSGSNWFIRCKFDHSPISVGLVTSQPFPNWAAATAYTVGQAVITGGYSVVCTVAGTSGGSPPTLKNYTLNIVDNTATWQLLAPSIYVGCLMQTTASENRFIQTDFSGTGYTASVQSLTSSNVMNFTDCVLNANFDINNCAACMVKGCSLNGPGYIKIYATNPGFVNLHDNWYSGAGNFFVEGNVNNFSIRGNYMGGGTIQVAAGTNNHYIISNNIAVTVTDLGTGVNKSITGNVA